MRSMDSIHVGFVACASSPLVLILIWVLILIFAFFLVILCCSHDEMGKNNGRGSWVEFVSWEPRAFICHNFLSEEECSQLINLAKHDMRRSLMFNCKLRKSVETSSRTSTEMTLDIGHDRLIRRIEKRIQEFTFIPIENGERLTILHYEVGQKINAHHDYRTDDEYNIKKFGQRMATFLMYLSDVEEGGETVFPAANEYVSSALWWKKLPGYGKHGLSVKPKKGDALLFWSMKPDGTLDRTSLHGSSPVIKGNKWVAVKLIHTKEIQLK